MVLFFYYLCPHETDAVYRIVAVMHDGRLQ